MRVLLIEDDSATAQSIELMLKSESFNVYTTDLGEEGVDLGKLYDYDIIVLGAGAAGLFCAFTAAQRGRRVLVLEKSNKVGKKILMSGGGRCNLFW